MIWDKLAADPLLEVSIYILIDNLMEILSFYLETNYFRMGFDVYQLEECLAVGSPLLPVLANVYMEYNKMPLGSTSLKLPLWLRYVDITFILWFHQQDVLEYHWIM